MSLEVIAREMNLSHAEIRQMLVDVVQPAVAQAATQAVQSAAVQAGQTLPANLPSFIAPPDLAAWNSLLGATQITKIAPVEVVLYDEILSGAENQSVGYNSPEGYVSMAMASFAGKFNYHSPNFTVLGFLNYGTPGAEPITDGAVILEDDLNINRVVTSGHQIRYNLTMLFTNGTAYDINMLLRTTFLQMPDSMFTQLYEPYEEYVAAWIQAIAAGRFVGGPHT